MVICILIYIIGIVSHKVYFEQTKPKTSFVLDYKSKEKLSFDRFLWMWPIFWVIYLFLLLKIKLVKMLKNRVTIKE